MPDLHLDLDAEGISQVALHTRAAAVTRRQFGHAVFVRAVVELSNFCRERCNYCGMRRSNRQLPRYRASPEQLAELILENRPPFVTDINLQAGEDPIAAREVALPLIEILRKESNLGISICLGTLDPALYRQLHAAGARVYIMKFECADPAEYAACLAPGTLAERLEHIRELASSGWSVSSGFIVGLPGQAETTLAHNLALALSLPLSGCSVSPFIPGESTPLAAFPPAPAHTTLNCMAALRLARPAWIIPAVSALNLVEHDGYRAGLRAGANLVTVNLTPESVRRDYVIYKRDRFIMTGDRVAAALEAEGLTPSPTGLAEYCRAAARTRADSPAFAWS